MKNLLETGGAISILIACMFLFSGCSLSTVQAVTNKLTTVAKIGTRSYNIAKVFYVSGRTVLVSGGIYALLPESTQLKLKALNTSLVTYDTFRTNVITIIKEEVESNKILVTESEDGVIISALSEESQE